MSFIAGVAAASARHGGGNRFRFPEQFAETRRAGGVDRGSKRQLHGFQIQVAGLAPFGKDARQQSV